MSQADATGDDDLVTLAKAYLKRRFQKPGNVFVGLVHRLDRPTSGVVALARTSKAASRLSGQFRTRSTDKSYLAVVRGHLGDYGEWVGREDGIVKGEGGSGGSVRVVPVGTPGSQRAALRWRTLDGDGTWSLVRVELETGRKHQIRAQLAALGHPILGDFRYGDQTSFAHGRGVALHAFRLALDHPTRAQRMTFVAAPPPTWAGRFDDAVAETVARARLDATTAEDGLPFE